MTLCPTCEHVRRVETARGSVFWMCERSKAEPERFPKYPPQPVVRCLGFVPAERPESRQPAGVDPPD